MIIRAICKKKKKNIGGIDMFNKIKKIAREHKHEFIICGIVVALTGAFLAWLINVAFLAIIILSFIWTGYFYFLGTEQPNVVTGEKTNYDVDAQTNVVTGEKTNYDVNAQTNVVTGEKTNYDVDAQMVSKYIETLTKVGKTKIKQGVDVICNLLKPSDQQSRGNDYFFDIVALHLNTIPWNTYSPELIAKNIKQIAGIMTNKSVEEIDQYLYEYREQVAKGKGGYQRIELDGQVWEMLGCINYGNTHNACVNVITLAKVIDKALERREKILNSIPEEQLTKILNARKLGPVPRMQKFGNCCLYEIEDSLKI